MILFIGDFVEQFRKSAGKGVSTNIIFQLTLLNFLSLIYFTLPLIVFSSYLYHRITPITKGHRYSIVGWVSGPPWK